MGMELEDFDGQADLQIFVFFLRGRGGGFLVHDPGGCLVRFSFHWMRRGMGDVIPDDLER